MKYLFLLCLFISGCSVIRVRDQEHKVFVTLYVPAYPWSDINKTLSRLSVTQRTNGFTVTLSGLNEETTGATNLALITESIVTGVVKGLK